MITIIELYDIGTERIKNERYEKAPKMLTGKTAGPAPVGHSLYIVSLYMLYMYLPCSPLEHGVSKVGKQFHEFKLIEQSR